VTARPDGTDTRRTPIVDLSRVPSIDRCLALEPVERLLRIHPRRTVVAAVRSAAGEIRRSLLAGADPDATASQPAVVEAIERHVDAVTRRRVRRVVNATGIILHTGLGRAVLSREARDAMAGAMGPAVVEIDPETGDRTVRTHAVQDLLRELTGAEAATVVNNNAAATMLILNTVAAGREVVVSRGELVEIGGSFRMPDVMEASGATLVDVGTTNRTHLRDFAEALTENTGALFRAHTSNYKVIGFTKAVELEELVALGRAHGIPVVDDVGSGALVDLDRFGFGEEPVVPRSIATGADLVCFSGDKLVGGPQAGFIVGRAEWIRRIEKNPLARAFRVDKLALAGIEATLRLFLDETTLFEKNPTLRMLATPAAAIEERAKTLLEELRAACPDLEARVARESAQLGSGSLPTEDLPTFVVAVRSEAVPCSDLARRLRSGDPSVFARVKNDELLLDPRTLQEGEAAEVVGAIARLLAR